MRIRGLLKINYVWLYIVIILFISFIDVKAELSHTRGNAIVGLTGFGSGSGITGDKGLFFNGNSFASFDIGSKQPKTIMPMNSKFSATIAALDPATHKVYMQEIRTDFGANLLLVDSNTGVSETSHYLSSPFKTLVFDSTSNILFGLTGNGSGSVSSYISISGNAFKQIDLTSQVQKNFPNNDTFIATAFALDIDTHTVYMERVQNDGVHLVSINVFTGELRDIKKLNYPLHNLVFDPQTRSLYGLRVLSTQGPQAWINSYGFLISGNGFGRINLKSLDESLICNEGGTFIAGATTYDPYSHIIYMEKIENDGVHLAALNVSPLSVPILTDINNGQPLLNPWTVFSIKSLPPSSYTLAKMSNEAYKDYLEEDLLIDPPNIDGYKMLYISDGDNSENFSAKVFYNDCHYVIAFRGTVPSTWYGLYYDLLGADAHIAFEAWPEDILISKLNSASLLLSKVINDYSPENKEISLTGHSLGGGLAQIISFKTNLPAVAFNAPKTSAIAYQEDFFKQEFDYINRKTSLLKQGSVNIRLYGDKISMAGRDPLNTKIITLDPLPEYGHAASNYVFLLKNHNIENIVAQLKLGVKQTIGIPDTNPDTPVSPISIVGSLTKLIVDQTFNFNFNVKAGIIQAIDPDSATEYTFKSNSNSSPYFSTIALPEVPGISNYMVSAFSHNEWTQPFSLPALQTFNFGGTTSGFRFWALDNSGQTIPMPDHFIFDASFASDGQFKGTLTTKKSTPSSPSDSIPPTPVEPTPEPPSDKTSSKSGGSGCFIQSVF